MVEVFVRMPRAKLEPCALTGIAESTKAKHAIAITVFAKFEYIVRLILLDPGF